MRECAWAQVYSVTVCSEPWQARLTCTRSIPEHVLFRITKLDHGGVALLAHNVHDDLLAIGPCVPVAQQWTSGTAHGRADNRRDKPAHAKRAIAETRGDNITNPHKEQSVGDGATHLTAACPYAL